MRSITITCLCLLLTAGLTARGEDPGHRPSGELLKFDIASPDQKWEFAEEEWCWYAAKMGVKMIEEANLDLSKYEWAFTEEYAHTPERLMNGREVAGYYIMIKDGKLSGGAGVPQEALDLPGFHVNVEWGLIAHPSSFFYGREGQAQRFEGGRQLGRDLEAAGKGKAKSTVRKVRTNYEGPTWPPGVGEALGKHTEQGGGLHNFTAFHLKPSPEVKDLPQTEWGVPILTKMTEQQKQDFYKLIGR